MRTQITNEKVNLYKALAKSSPQLELEELCLYLLDKEAKRVAQFDLRIPKLLEESEEN